MNMNSYSPSGESFFAKKWTKRQQWTARLVAGAVLISGVVAAVAFASGNSTPSAEPAVSTADPIPVAVATIEPKSE